LLYDSATVIDTVASKTGPSRFHSDQVLSSQILFGEMKEAIVRAMKCELDNTKNNRSYLLRKVLTSLFAFLFNFCHIEATLF